VTEARKYTEPNQPFDPSKDRRPWPSDLTPCGESVRWRCVGTIRANPGSIVRIVPGSNPPETTLTEIFTFRCRAFGPRGGDVDKERRLLGLLGSGHIGEVRPPQVQGPPDGPQARGDHCPEGWAFHKYPGPGSPASAIQPPSRATIVGRPPHALGMGENVPVSTANLMDGLVALGKDARWLSLRVPYPMGFFAKGLDGRIDDPNAVGRAGDLGRRVATRPVAGRGRQGHEADGVHFQLAA